MADMMLSSYKEALLPHPLLVSGKLSSLRVETEVSELPANIRCAIKPASESLLQTRQQRPPAPSQHGARANGPTTETRPARLSPDR